MVEIDNADGSISIISEGCDPDFLDQIPQHLAFIQGFFLGHGIKLDGTIEQVKALESFISSQQEASKPLHTREFFQGLVAYCGELLRVPLAGRWALKVGKAFSKYPCDRYFPAIIDAEGEMYAFSAQIEAELAYLLNPGLNWDKMEGLYYRLLFELPSRVKLPVKPLEAWFFPPLNEASE